MKLGMITLVGLLTEPCFLNWYMKTLEVVLSVTWSQYGGNDKTARHFVCNRLASSDLRRRYLGKVSFNGESAHSPLLEDVRRFTKVCKAASRKTLKRPHCWWYTFFS